MTEFLAGRPSRLAYNRTDGAGPTVVFLCGYGSNMTGSKALALEAWAQAQGRAFLRFDYAGCGESDGAFEDQTLVSWRDDALAAVDALTEGPVVLVGSSMGGWIMLMVSKARPDRIAAMISIAAAPDFTSWGFTDAQKAELHEKGRLEEPSPYSDEPTVTTLALWESGEANLMLTAPFDTQIPVRLLHGQCDDDVPWRNSLKLAELLRSSDVQTWLVKDGDHRLSRGPDIALLLRAVEDVSSICSSPRS
jgi:pimeloyl-ACP methyl ester carboxylesterase